LVHPAKLQSSPNFSHRHITGPSTCSEKRKKNIKTEKIRNTDCNSNETNAAAEERKTRPEKREGEKQTEKIKQLKKTEREESHKAKRKLDVSRPTPGPSRKSSKPSARNKKSMVESIASSDVWICS